jgi:hypothetical protein
MLLKLLALDQIAEVLLQGTGLWLPEDFPNWSSNRLMRGSSVPAKGCKMVLNPISTSL